MSLKIKSIYFLIIIAMGVITPILTAHLPPIFNAVFSKLCLISLLTLTCVSLLRAPQKKAAFIFRSPAFIFFCYLIAQSLLTIASANSPLRIAISNVMFVVLFMCCFFIPALLSSYLNIQKIVRTLNILIFAAGISVAIDLLGYGKVFGGSYGDFLPERLGFSQVHGFMPWPNAFATYLLVFSLLLHIFKPNSKSTWGGFVLIFPTLVRAHIVSTIVILLTAVKSRLMKIVLVGVVLFVASNSLSDFISDSAKELNIDEGASSVYRLSYIVNSSQALLDYPLLGVGLNRLTNRSTWEQDNFSLHNRYQLPKELFGNDMGSSDTGLTFFYEVGLIGVVLYLFQLVHFVILAYRLNCKNYALFVVSQLLLLYSFPSIVLSVTFGIYYWFLYGNLIARSWEKKSDVASNVQVS